MMDLLFGMQAEFGTTLLLITHDPALAARCDRRIRIADGRVLDGEPVEDRGAVAAGRPGSAA